MGDSRDQAQNMAKHAQNRVDKLKAELVVLNGIADGYFKIQAAAEDAGKAAIKGAGLTPFDTNKAEEKLRKEEERKRKAEEAAARRKQTQADKEARAAERQENTPSMQRKVRTAANRCLTGRLCETPCDNRIQCQMGSGGVGAAL